MGKILFFICCLFSSIFALSQDVDSLFSVMKENAYNGKREEARKIGTEILQIENNYDVQLLVARTYIWDDKYDSAEIVINQVLKMKPSYYDALDAKLDLLYWDEKYDKGVAFADSSLHFFPNEAIFFLKKAKILVALNRKEEAILVLKKGLISNPNDAKLKEMLYNLEPDLYKNKVSLNYSFDYFSKVLDPWHFLSAQYLRRTKKLGAVIGRVNYANRFKTNGIQVEMDAYPTLSAKKYAYFNIGYAGTGIFPNWRAGTDIYQKLPKSFEMALGVRYLRFVTTDVFIYSVYLGKYKGDYWIGLRSFITPSKLGVSTSGSILIRKYLEDSDNYWGIRASYGISPDERRRIEFENNPFYLLKSATLRFEYNKMFNKRWMLNTSLNNELQEYFTNLNRYVLTFDVTFSRFF